MPTRAAVWILALLSSAPACGRIVHTQEAENSTIVCAAGSCANLDCCTLYTGAVDANAPGPLRPTRLLRSARQQFQICATPQAVLPAAPAEIADRFEQLYEMMAGEYGVKLPTPIWVHFADPVHWSHGSRRFIRNRFGIYLVADSSTIDRTGWCLTLADAFSAVPVPRWFFHSAACAQVHWPHHASHLDCADASPTYMQCTAVGSWPPAGDRTIRLPTPGSLRSPGATQIRPLPGAPAIEPAFCKTPKRRRVAALQMALQTGRAGSECVKLIPAACRRTRQRTQ